MTDSSHFTPSSDGQVIDCNLLYHPLGIDDEEAAVGDAQLFNKDAVPCTDVLGNVSEDGDLRSIKKDNPEH